MKHALGVLSFSLAISGLPVNADDNSLEKQWSVSIMSPVFQMTPHELIEKIRERKDALLKEGWWFASVSECYIPFLWFDGQDGKILEGDLGKLEKNQLLVEQLDKNIVPPFSIECEWELSEFRIEERARITREHQKLVREALDSIDWGKQEEDFN